MGHRHLEQTEAWYDRFYASDKSLFGHWTAQQHRTVTWYPALLLATGSIFEVGCGAGHFAAMCKAYGKKYLLGTDYSQYALRLASRNAPGTHFKRMNAVSDDYELALLEHEPDTVVALEVLEHVWDDLSIIERLPAGTAFVGSVPSFFTEGHVRWFENTQQVKERYGKLLVIKRVIEEHGVKSSNRWFVFKGVRK